MCGRYALYDLSKSKIKNLHNTILRSYNIAPSSKVPVINKNHEVIITKWALQAPWSHKPLMFNARSETLSQKVAFKNCERCVFIANGYFEWLHENGEKIPYYHTFDNRMMYFGGIFNHTGACIVTRESYEHKFKVHHRQPVLLANEDFDFWFAEKHDFSCRHLADMKIYRVSSIVNSSKNDSIINILPT